MENFMTNKYKALTLPLLIATLAGCGSYYKTPESIESKMARFESRKPYINKVPSFTTSKAPKVSRFPASANSEGEQINESNLSIYFLSLYEQYETMTSLYPDSKQALKSCPTFHQELLKRAPSSYSYNLRADISFAQDSIISSLAFSNEQAKDSKTLAVAMDQHIRNTYSELRNLCEFGQSDNYYIYENFITLVNKGGKIKKNSEGINALLKTTVFYNQALISNISHKEKIRVKSRGLASAQNPTEYSQEAIRRLKASWAQESFE